MLLGTNFGFWFNKLNLLARNVWQNKSLTTALAVVWDHILAIWQPRTTNLAILDLKFDNRVTCNLPTVSRKSGWNGPCTSLTNKRVFHFGQNDKQRKITLLRQPVKSLRLIDPFCVKKCTKIVDIPNRWYTERKGIILQYTRFPQKNARWR